MTGGVLLTGPMTVALVPNVTWGTTGAGRRSALIQVSVTGVGKPPRDCVDQPSISSSHT